MYPHANTGNEPNNVKLSPCSTEIMGPILSIRASCFEGERAALLIVIFVVYMFLFYDII